MKISARNILTGKVTQVVWGAVNAEVALELSPGLTITAMITKSSAERLGLKPGVTAHAVIKASDVMIAVD